MESELALALDDTSLLLMVVLGVVILALLIALLLPELERRRDNWQPESGVHNLLMTNHLAVINPPALVRLRLVEIEAFAP